MIRCALAIVGLLACCSKEPERAGRPSAQVWVLKVEGMQRGEGGKTWMAWPEAVKKALEGLKGVAKVEMDLAQDLFRVTPAENSPPPQEALLSAIRQLGYKAALADPSIFRSAPGPVHPVGDPPDLIRKALERAKTEGKKYVLVDCMGDDWAACKKMSVTTFAHPQVKTLIDRHFVFVELNVAQEREAAAWFGSEAIPDTWILDLEGKMLDRVVGFEEPEAFVERLRKVVEGR